MVDNLREDLEKAWKDTQRQTPPAPLVPPTVSVTLLDVQPFSLAGLYTISTLVNSTAYKQASDQ